MFQIFAHRGLLGYPENTLLSFQKALEKGFGIELDVHRTIDGYAVVTHDASLKRLYGVDVNVAGQSLQKIRKISIAKNHPIATLEEVLELSRRYGSSGTLAAVQIRDSSEEKIAGLVVGVFESFNEVHPDFNVYERAFVFDPTKEVAEQLKKLQSRLKVALSVGEDSLFAQQRYRTKYPSVYSMADVEHFPYFDIVWADEWQGDLLSQEFIQKCHGLGKKVYVISPELHASTNPAHPLANDMGAKKQLWKNLKEWGADGICTDHPEDFRAVYDAAH